MLSLLSPQFSFTKRIFETLIKVYARWKNILMGMQTFPLRC